MVIGTTRYLILLALPWAVAAQEFQTLEQAASRTERDWDAAYEGRTVAVRAQVSAAPVWAVGVYYLPVRDLAGHGLLLRGDREQFAGVTPGDWIEVRGTIQSRGGLPLLAPSAIITMRHDVPPEPKELALSDLCRLRYLGLVVRTYATVTAIGENLGGKTLQVSDHGSSLAVFLPRAANSSAPQLMRLRAGDRVRLTGLATQYSLEPPHDSGFQLMLTGPGDVEVLAEASMVPPVVLASAAGVIALLLGVWWIRERRMSAQRRSMRAFHALSEEIVSAASPVEIAEKLAGVLPAVTRATSVRLYLFSRRNNSLERVPTSAEPEPMAVAIDAPPDGLASGAVVCFRNRTLLNIPDVRRSPFVNPETKLNLPRSAMFVPLFAQNGVLGVLEVGNGRRPGYFTLEEQAATQHLANQVAAALKLQDQQTMREQLFRSEKLAATGQLISGVASELRAPLENILQLSNSLTAYRGRAVTDHDLRRIAGESQRAAEIVSRLVSFARPEDAGATQVDVHALVAGLMQFREPEWKARGLRIQNRLPIEPALVVGVQGQLEQVFLNLLVHAEQCAADAPGKSIAVTGSVIARHVLVEIAYSEPPSGARGADPLPGGNSIESGALGLGVCQGILQSHGGEFRFSMRSGMARFEVELPAARRGERDLGSEVRKAAGSLTLMLVDPEAGGQRQILALLGARGHRVVPVPAEEAVDLSQRLRFDAVLWAMRPSGSRWSDFYQKIHDYVPVFILLIDGYDAELARSMESAGGFLLSRPIEVSELDRVLKYIESSTAGAAK